MHAATLVLAIRDAYPVAPGHTLVLPRRHVARLAQLHDDERAALFELAERARRALDTELRPDGYTLGINDGAAAGQTVPHLHLHLIPRFAGDRPDPRGGVRWVLPERADYWSNPGSNPGAQPWPKP